MYKFLVTCCSLLLGVSLCAAQPGKKKTVPDNKSLLWKISGNGLKKPSYLFGTIHIICPSDYLWTPAMQKALDASETVAFEMDMDDPSLQGKMTQGLMLQNGKTLKDFYTPDEYKRLSDIAAENAIPLSMMQNFSPFALVSFLYIKAITCSIPDNYEANIMKLAQDQDKAIEGLESIDEQLKAIEHMNADSIAASVLHIAEDMGSFKKMMQEMMTVYKKQDLPALYELIISSPDYKDDLNSLLFERNEKWIPVISGMAEKQPSFIAVGAGHLWGERGVIALMKKQGYTLTPVR